MNQTLRSSKTEVDKRPLTPLGSLLYETVRRFRSASSSDQELEDSEAGKALSRAANEAQCLVERVTVFKPVDSFKPADSFHASNSQF